MKNIIIKGLGAVLLAGSMVSCADDYLDLNPLTYVDNSTVVEDEIAIRYAVYGIFQNQYRQYSQTNSSWWFNGEPWVAMIYGETLGQDFFSNFWSYRSSNLVRWSLMNMPNSVTSYDAWMYAYTIISQANNIIGTDNDNLQGEIAFRMAQAYTMRAHAYVRLMQIYGPRKADSNNGMADAVVIRTPENSTDENVPLSSFSDVMNLIYSDLNRAITLYQISKFSRDNVWEADLEIAQGIYSRAALINEDWKTAYNMATAAREGWDIMSADEYVACGFANPNSTEWMWATDNASDEVYYWSFGAVYACNAVYHTSGSWGTIGGNSVNLDLYRQVYNPNDIRCSLFFTPDKVAEEDQANFWNASYVSPSTMNCAQSGFKNEFFDFLLDKIENVMEPNGFGGYYPYWNGSNTAAGIGTQFKFWSYDYYGDSSFPMMRTSELLLTAAEAACHLNNDAAAQALIDEIQKNRISDYAGTTLTGKDLLAYVQLTRRWELWGEGFNWFDFKRWNIPVVRNAWVEGDPTSGNIPSTQAYTYDTSLYDGWKWAIPEAEINYNGDI